MSSELDPQLLHPVISAVMDKLAQQPRVICAIAGPPGAGKSTLSESLVVALHRQGVKAVVVPMDGFHYDDTVLKQLELSKRKGSPPSFDFEGYENSLQRLRQEAGRVALPKFNRATETAHAGAILVEEAHRVIITEGNYLLYNRAPWNRLATLFDVKVFLHEPLAELEQRLLNRWVNLGFSEDAAREKYASNDGLNLREVMEHRLTDGVFSLSHGDGEPA